MHEYVGHMHIHSTYSDGSGSLAKITAAARRAELDFIITTDHNTLAPRDNGEEGFHQGVLLLTEVELNAEDGKHHCLAFGLKELPSGRTAPAEMLAWIASKGGFSFLAHPFELGSPIMKQGKAYTWERLPEKDFTGLEIWNFSSRWRDGVSNYPVALLRYYLKMPGRALSPCPITLKKWDEVTLKRRVAAVGGSDAHALHYYAGPFKAVLFPYEYLFKGVNMHIYLREALSPSFAEASRQVSRALEEGNSSVALDLLRPSKGFAVKLRAEDREYLPGEEAPFAQGSVIFVRAPLPCSLIKIICDGQEVHRSKGPNLAFKVLRPGVFRCETWLKYRGRYRPWIYANPFYIRR